MNTEPISYWSVGVLGSVLNWLSRGAGVILCCCAKANYKVVDISGVSYSEKRGPPLAQMSEYGRQTCLFVGPSHLGPGFEKAESIARWSGKGDLCRGEATCWRMANGTGSSKLALQCLCYFLCLAHVAIPGPSVKSDLNILA